MIQKPSMTKDKKRPIPVIFKILCVLILGVIGWESFIYVSPIKGRVVDAETGKPMKGTNVRGGWVTGYVLPYGGFSKTFKVYATMADENGEFVLPRTIKLKIPIIERYQGVDMLFYEHGYVSKFIEKRSWREGGKIQYYQIPLKIIKNEREYEENLGKLWNSQVGSDYSFIIAETKNFLEKYPNNPLYDAHLREIASAYKKLGHYKSAEEVYKEIINRNLSTYDIEEAKKEIRLLKQDLSERQGPK